MAIKIEVRVFATLREIMDPRITVELAEGATAGDLLDRFASHYEELAEILFDDDGKLRPFVNVLRNGRNIHFIDGLATTLADGDVVAIFPPAGGG
jgi:MoaD family protein